MTSRRNVRQRFLKTMQDWHWEARQYPRSNGRTKILHGWIQEELKRELGRDYQLTGQSRSSSHEATVEGLYYPKKVDILVSRGGRNLGIISVKSAASNYSQNSNNYFENLIGETANLRGANIAYGHFFCITYPVPYYEDGGYFRNWEYIKNHHIQKYFKLQADSAYQLHVPDEMAIGIVDLDTDGDAITGITDPATMDISDAIRAALVNELSVEHFSRRMARRIEALWEQPI